MLDDQAIRGLLLRAAARDEGSAAAFQRLYEASAPRLLGVALRILGRRELAEEVLHDAFVRIWDAARGFDPLAERPFAWMAAIVRHRAIDLRASHDVSRVDSYHDAPLDADPDGSLERLVEPGPGADQAAERNRAARWLRECLGRLPAFERQSLVLAYEHGLSHRELAAHLQKPLGTVKAWVRRGMASLRTCVEAHLGDAP
ncbi:MAG TPA: sigma-70 family RNA polymerase sigma factor [Burkholderiales bacterium]|nr:sigma-70 family RNA polymerase sigma factor [Burkholderiales bacterium]